MTLIYFKGDKLAAYEGREDDFQKISPKYRFMNLLDVLDRMCIRNNILVLFGMYLQDEFHRAETINDQELVRKMIARFIVQLSVETDEEENCKDIYVSSVVAVRFNEFVCTLSKFTFYDSILAAGYAIDDPDYKDADSDDDEDEEPEPVDERKNCNMDRTTAFFAIKKFMDEKYQIEVKDISWISSRRGGLNNEEIEAEVWLNTKEGNSFRSKVRYNEKTETVYSVGVLYH